MKPKIGYIIKSNNKNYYKFIIPFWKKNFKYKKIQLNIQKNYLYDSRNEISNNFIILVKFDSKKKKYTLIKILY